MTGRDANETMLRRLIDAFWNGGPDYSVFGEFFHGDAVLHADGVDYPGRDGLCDGFAAPFYAAFPDLVFDIRQLVVEEDQAAMRYRGRGHLMHDYGGARATSQCFEYHGIAIFGLRDGKIAEVWSQSDFGAWLAAQPRADQPIS